MAAPSPSPIQTILSAPESTPESAVKLAGLESDFPFTAGRELHPAPKMNQYFITTLLYTKKSAL